MSQSIRNKSFLALTGAVFFAFTGPIAAAADHANPSGKPNFRLVDEYRVVVPVMIDGLGTFDFLLDTGANSTSLDEKLARQLNLPKVGENTMSGVQGMVEVAVVRTSSITVAGGTVTGMEIEAQKAIRDMPSKVRGILGEDFLKHFDVLLDYQHRVLVLDQLATGSLAETLDGEKLAVRLKGSMRGNPTPDRLVVEGQADELGVKGMALLLDSGASSVMLFGGQQVLGAKAKQQSFSVASELQRAGNTSMKTLAVKKLHFGGKAVSDVTVLAPAAVAGMDVEGVMPTSMFKSIYISHAGSYVILNPVPRTSRGSNDTSVREGGASGI